MFQMNFYGNKGALTHFLYELYEDFDHDLIHQSS